MISVNSFKMDYSRMKEDYLIRIINNLTNYGTNVGQKGQGYGDNKR